MSEWRSIESAPKDGSRVIVWNGAPFFVTWQHECQFERFETRPGWSVFECEDSFYSWGFEPDEPTHWMPLPESPVSATPK